MKDVMGVIYTTKDDIALRELTASRAVAALPWWGATASSTSCSAAW